MGSSNVAIVSKHNDFCLYASESKDGLAHYLPDRVYSNITKYSTACNSLRALYAVPGTFSNSVYTVSSEAFYGTSADDQGQMNVQIVGGGWSTDYIVCRGLNKSTGPDAGGNDECNWTPGAFTLVRAEASDNVKRFVNSNGGWKPDPSDPDWTQAELDKSSLSNVTMRGTIGGNVSRLDATQDSTGTMRLQAVRELGNGQSHYREIWFFPEGLGNGKDDIYGVAGSGGTSESVYSDNPGLSPSNTSSGNPGGTSTSGSGGTASGGATTGDWVKESTGQSQLSKLTTIANAFKSETGVIDPTVPGAEGFADAFFKETFGGLNAWTLPGHSSVCPTSSFSAFDHTFIFDSHCALIQGRASARQSHSIGLKPDLVLFFM
jgi:hypothetical protein